MIYIRSMKNIYVGATTRLRIEGGDLEHSQYQGSMLSIFPKLLGLSKKCCRTCVLFFKRTLFLEDLTRTCRQFLRVRAI